MQALFGKDSLQDFLHIDNLVQAHILAGRALMESNRRVAVSNTSLSEPTGFLSVTVYVPYFMRVPVLNFASLHAVLICLIIKSRGSTKLLILILIVHDRII